ncbi:hypothetical protein JHV675_51320 [Mycobacterium avium subsp. hominissuis]
MAGRGTAETAGVMLSATLGGVASPASANGCEATPPSVADSITPAVSAVPRPG